MSLTAIDLDQIFVEAIERTLGNEGRYSNDPLDHGGETMWGVSLVQARACGYGGPMAEMPREIAIGIYRVFYWTQPRFDWIANVSPKLASVMLDLGINCGPSVPSKELQRCLNALKLNGTAYHDIPVDGMVGVMTLSALRSYVQFRSAEGERVLIAIVRAVAGVRYLELAEANPTQERFEFGWLSKRAFPAQA